MTLVPEIEPTTFVPRSARDGEGDDHPDSSVDYATLLAAARRVADRLHVEQAEIARLEALAQTREGRPVLRGARVAAAVLALVVGAAVPIISGTYDTPHLVTAGLVLNAGWLGDQGGLASRRGTDAQGWRRLLTWSSLAAAVAGTALAVTLIGQLVGWVWATTAVMSAAASALGGWAGSSGDPVADRIHGELAATRVAARGTEVLLSHLEEMLRARQTADLATLSRVAPWPQAPDGDDGEP